MTRTTSSMPGGRVTARRLAVASLIALCALGGLRLAQGAIVPAKAVVAQFLLEHAFDRSMTDNRAHKPWPWADMAPIARLRVPRLDVSRIVLDIGSGQAMAFGPTLLPASARFGEAGTAVIAAHRDTHFRFLEHVKIGDTLLVDDLNGKTRQYQVTGTQIVRWNRFATVHSADKQRLALATCYPFGAAASGPLRYVVRATAVDGGNPTAADRSVTDRAAPSPG